MGKHEIHGEKRTWRLIAEGVEEEEEEGEEEEEEEEEGGGEE